MLGKQEVPIVQQEMVTEGERKDSCYVAQADFEFATLALLVLTLLLQTCAATPRGFSSLMHGRQAPVALQHRYVCAPHVSSHSINRTQNSLADSSLTPGLYGTFQEFEYSPTVFLLIISNLISLQLQKIICTVYFLLCFLKSFSVKQDVRCVGVCAKVIKSTVLFFSVLR